MAHKSLRIVMISSECVPFAKTGGLADVVGALPKVLQKLGHQVIVIMPRYSSINYLRHKLRPFMNHHPTFTTLYKTCGICGEKFRRIGTMRRLGARMV